MSVLDDDLETCDGKQETWKTGAASLDTLAHALHVMPCVDSRPMTLHAC